MERTAYQLEISGETATLYLSSSFDASNTQQLQNLCAGLPRSVRLLRVDLHAIAAMNESVLSAMRVLINHWRSSGQADVRLSFRTPHIVATFSADATDQLMPRHAYGSHMAREAFTAAFI